MPKAIVIKSLSNNGVPANTGDIIELSDTAFANLVRKGWVTETNEEVQDEQPQTKKRRH